MWMNYLSWLSTKSPHSSSPKRAKLHLIRCVRMTHSSKNTDHLLRDLCRSECCKSARISIEIWSCRNSKPCWNSTIPSLRWKGFCLSAIGKASFIQPLTTMLRVREQLHLMLRLKSLTTCSPSATSSVQFSKKLWRPPAAASHKDKGSSWKSRRSLTQKWKRHKTRNRRCSIARKEIKKGFRRKRKNFRNRRSLMRNDLSVNKTSRRSEMDKITNEWSLWKN